MKTGKLSSRGDWFVVAIIIVIVASSISFISFSNNSISLEEKKEIADSIRKSKDYVGPPEYMKQNRSEKYAKGTIVDLNTADSLTLIKVPGIGASFAHRIISLRNRLGGFYTVEQLQEVYGMDEDKYLALKRWFAIKTKQKTYYIDELRADELPDIIYLSYKQKKAINRILYRNGKISSWKELMKLEEFSYDDSVRLSHYIIEKE